ncbi:ATP-binding protein [Methanotrichaceae archaeon Mx]|uniref:ATP-binding protein n=2 Tax=Candidatus Methanocrinis natronophilus TaxID=3033396 RepID=A0ABT5X9X0_9EURY|nr:ATP-binding protein [Candidatus Methanocrinis natronophilus]
MAEMAEMANLSDERWKENRGQQSASPEGLARIGQKPQTITMDESSNPYFRIISKDVREYHFIVPSEEWVELGEIVSIHDRRVERGATFLARITDLRHDSNYDGNWDTVIRGDGFYDSDQIFCRVVAEPLGCMTKEAGGRERFRKSRTIPAKFSPVRKAEKEELRFLGEVMGDIEVGRLRNGSRDVKEIPVALHSDAMDHHMGVFATTGMGKSNFMKVFAASCMRMASSKESKFGLLIVDPHGEYIFGSKGTKGLLHLDRYREGIVCYSTDKRHLKDPSVSNLTVKRSEILPQDIEVLYDWTPAQREALEAVSRVFYGEEWLDDLLTSEGAAKMIAEGFHEKTIGRIGRTIRTILDKNRYISDLTSSIPGMVNNLLAGKVVLVDIPTLGERSELFLLSLLSRSILDRYKKESAEGSRGKSCLITIEEAQRVLGGGEGSLARFESIAREGRKFGVGLCAITQQPKLINKQLLSQFNTFVILGLADRNDRTRLEESAKQDLSTLDVEIQTLEKGEAIVSTLKIPFPVPARVHLYEEYLERLNREGSSGGRGRIGGFSPPPD